MLTGLAVFVLTLVQPAAGQTYKWVDKHGNTRYQDQPPPDDVRGVVRLQHRDHHPNQGQASLPKLVFYSVPVCDSCDLVRQYLNKRNIGFTEKNVKENADLVRELRDLSGGLSVPVLKIGDDFMSGYSKTALNEKLGTFGFKIELKN